MPNSSDIYEDYAEMLKEKDAKKRSLMTEKEIAESEQFLEWYRRAYNDKCRLNLPQKWQDVDKYWEGDLEEPEDEADPASNTNITNSHVEGVTTLLCDQSISIQVDPREPGDRPFCDMVRTLADFIKERNKMYRKIDVHERRRDKYGIGIFKVLWNFDKLDGKGMPEITTINPDRFFVDPAITDVQYLQEAQYCIEVRNRSIYSARQEFGDDLADAIIPNLDPVQDVIVENEEDQYVHMYVWIRYRDKKGNRQLRLVEMSGDGVILRDTKKELEKHSKKKEKEGQEDDEELMLFPNTTYPYFLTTDMARENTIWGKGSAELVLPISDQVDQLDNDILRNMDLTGNPMGVVTNNSGIDPSKVTNAPGQILVSNTSDGFKWLSPPTVPQYVLNKRTELMGSDRTIVTRFSDQMIGKQQSGVDTATESLALQNSGNAMIDHKKALLQETLSEVFEYAIELALLNWNTTMIFRIVGKDGQDDFMEFNPERLNHVPVMIESDTDYRENYIQEYLKRNPKANREDIDPNEYKYMQADNEERKVQYDLTVSVGAGLPNNRAYRFNIVRQARADHAISNKEYRNYLIKQLGLNIPEIPASVQEQKEIGIYSEDTQKALEELAQNQSGQAQGQAITQNANIEGLTANGNVSKNYLKGA